jgi:hypothetical protein
MVKIQNIVLGNIIITQKRRIKMRKLKDLAIFAIIMAGFFYGLSVINYHAELLNEVERVTGKYTDQYYDKPNLISYDEEAYRKDMEEHKQKLLQQKNDSLFKNGEYKVPKGL